MDSYNSSIHSPFSIRTNFNHFECLPSSSIVFNSNEFKSIPNQFHIPCFYQPSSAPQYPYGYPLDTCDSFGPIVSMNTIGKMAMSDSLSNLQEKSVGTQPSSHSPSEDDGLYDSFDDRIKDFLKSSIDQSPKIISKKPVAGKQSSRLCRNKAPQGKKRQIWKPEEDMLVLQYVEKYGQKWTQIASLMGNRKGKQVRDRYLIVLKPSINKSTWTQAEDEMILSQYEKYGPQWCLIVKHLKGRTEAQVKNRYSMHLKGVFAALKRTETKKISQHINQNDNFEGDVRNLQNCIFVQKSNFDDNFVVETSRNNFSSGFDSPFSCDQSPDLEETPESNPSASDIADMMFAFK